MVMLFHFVGHHDESALARKFSAIGQTGVDLFFVLSGFLITRILLNSKSSTTYFSSFYGRRILRIFPLYYGFLAIHFFVLPRYLATTVPALHQQIWSWLFLENLPSTFQALDSRGPGHYWSLAVEEHFYLLWPLLVFTLSTKTLSRVIVGILCISPIVRLLLLERGVEVFFLTITRIDAIAAGAYLALLQFHGGELGRYLCRFRILSVAAFSALVLMLLAPSGSGELWMRAFKFSLIPGFYFGLVGVCLIGPASRGLSSFFSHFLLRWIGRISFGLYVFHPACFQIMRAYLFFNNFFIDLFAAFLLTFAVSWVSYRYYETPFLMMKRYFRSEPPVTEIQPAS
jgi:peptidoglycan/LPS O-acetylase OafA/YrhL